MKIFSINSKNNDQESNYFLYIKNPQRELVFIKVFISLSNTKKLLGTLR
jgi:hypothetical protein